MLSIYSGVLPLDRFPMFQTMGYWVLCGVSGASIGGTAFGNAFEWTQI